QDHDAALQGQGRRGPALVAERALRCRAGRLQRIGRAVLAAGQPGLHRTLEPAIENGLRDTEPGQGEEMSSKGYTVLGWLVWQFVFGAAKKTLAENRVKLGAIGVIALVLAGGAVAAKATGGDE